jgi:hypothetical protein
MERVLCGLAAEVIFAILPLTVVLMVLLDIKESARWYASPEWSFGASILFGQALVKLLVGLVRGGRAHPGPVALVIALCILIGLTPSFFLLHITLRAESSCPYQGPGAWVEVAQILWFVVGAAVYIFLGAVGETWGRTADPPR